jgi:hypothetical protein
VARRATCEPAAEPAAGDYPDVGDSTAPRWKAALEALDASHANLATAVQGISDDHLLKPSNDLRNRPLGTGVSYYELLHGIVQHDAYHAGQIAILKKVLGVSKCQGLGRNAVTGRDRLTNGRCGTMWHFFRTERSAKPPRVANSSRESRSATT